MPECEIICNVDECSGKRKRASLLFIAYFIITMLICWLRHVFIGSSVCLLAWNDYCVNRNGFIVPFSVESELYSLIFNINQSIDATLKRMNKLNASRCDAIWSHSFESNFLNISSNPFSFLIALTCEPVNDTDEKSRKERSLHRLFVVCLIAPKWFGFINNDFSYSGIIFRLNKLWAQVYFTHQVDVDLQGISSNESPQPPRRTWAVAKVGH